MKVNMDEHEFLKRVQNEAHLNGVETARTVTEATLRTLGEHTSAGEAADTDALLPEGLRNVVTERSDETPQEFSVDEFYRRVGEETGVEPKVARTNVRAVMATLAAAVGNNELQDVREQLPNEYDSLFEPPEPED